MKPIRPFYPPLAAAFPVLAIFSANLALFSPHDIWRPLAWAFVIGTALWGVGSLLRWNIERGAWLGLMAIIGVWSAVPVHDRAPGLMYGLFVVLIALGFLKNPPTLVLNRLALGLVLASGGMSYYRAHVLHGNGQESKSTVADISSPPDIVYVILDGYGRADQLKRVFGYDNTPFIGELRKRGFFVAENSHSNYCQTLLSLGATLNLDYIPALLPNASAKDEAREPMLGLVNDSNAARIARSHGYQIVAVTTGFPSLSFEHADVVLETPPTVTLFESTLLERLPTPQADEVNISQFVQRRQALESGFANLQSLAVPAVAPRLVIAHILAPHPPFVFDAQGKPVRPKGNFGYFDGSDFMSRVGTAAQYAAGYTGQLQWVNQNVLKTVDTLLASKRPTIVILQGDHGSKQKLAQNDLSATDLDECFSNLQAVHAPPALQSQFTDDWTPINTFRVLFGGLFKEKLPALPSRSYYSPFVHPYDFTDVTNRLTKSVPTPR